MLIFLLDPGKQLHKAKDAQRKEDFDQIRIALDTYYNDFNCYPTTVSFGQEWKVGNTVYMKKVPQDPNCSPDETCYAYVVASGATCPQWNVLFGKLRVAPPPAVPACLLQDDCLPINYASGYNFCDFGGNIDCSSIQTTSLPLIDEEIPIPIPSPSPASSPPVVSSTPTPGVSIPQDGIYYCGCGNNHVTVCNVTFGIPDGVPYFGNSSCSNQCGQPC